MVVPISQPFTSVNGKGEMRDVFVPKDTTIHVCITALNRSTAIWGADAKELEDGVDRRRERSLERRGGGRGEEVMRRGPGGEPVARGRSHERIIVVADPKRTTAVQQVRAQEQVSRDPSRLRQRACSRSSVVSRRESRVRDRQAQNGWR